MVHNRRRSGKKKASITTLVNSIMFKIMNQTTKLAPVCGAATISDGFLFSRDASGHGMEAVAQSKITNQ